MQNLNINSQCFVHIGSINGVFDPFGEKKVSIKMKRAASFASSCIIACGCSSYFGDDVKISHGLYWGRLSEISELEMPLPPWEYLQRWNFTTKPFVKQFSKKSERNKTPSENERWKKVFNKKSNNKVSQSCSPPMRERKSEQVVRTKMICRRRLQPKYPTNLHKSTF